LAYFLKSALQLPKLKHNLFSLCIEPENKLGFLRRYVCGHKKGDGERSGIQNTGIID
jgi:hypothetical protein